MEEKGERLERVDEDMPRGIERPENWTEERNGSEMVMWGKEGEEKREEEGEEGEELEREEEGEDKGEEEGESFVHHVRVRKHRRGREKIFSRRLCRIDKFSKITPRFEYNADRQIVSLSKTLFEYFNR